MAGGRRPRRYRVIDAERAAGAPGCGCDRVRPSGRTLTFDSDRGARTDDQCRKGSRASSCRTGTDQPDPCRGGRKRAVGGPSERRGSVSVRKRRRRTSGIEGQGNPLRSCPGSYFFACRTCIPGDSGNTQRVCFFSTYHYRASKEGRRNRPGLSCAGSIKGDTGIFDGSDGSGGYPGRPFRGRDVSRYACGSSSGGDDGKAEKGSCPVKRD
ncbi:hypothetical protein IMSAGC015_02155 [Lachnospiraceae bacterium]|nr:hypothetical protein IMSAGC015_02155 [Lachnospiraceae bacterium]